jgi:ABC-type multidrug transport system fused ATPase/permease subunit
LALKVVTLVSRYYVVDNGKIVERGNHEQLLKEKGVYRHMVFSQFENAEKA